MSNVKHEKMMKESNQIAMKIKKGSIKGKKAIQKAKYRMYNLNYRASQLDKLSRAASETKLHKVMKSKGKGKDQSFLPGFLSQMNMVRVEELIAEKVFAALKRGEKIKSASITVVVPRKKKTA